MITPAFAQSAGSAGGGDMLIQLVPFILIFVIMWFLIIRPQQRRVKAHQALVARLQVGDEVMTTSGFYGRIVAVEDADIRLELAPGTVVRIARGAVARRLGEEAGPGQLPAAGEG